LPSIRHAHRLPSTNSSTGRSSTRPSGKRRPLRTRLPRQYRSDIRGDRGMVWWPYGRA
jgi:hypothetical protein